MKQIIRRCAAALCAGLLLTALPCAAADSTGETERIGLPSGKTLADAQQALQNIASQNGGSDEYYAAALVGIFHDQDVLYTEYFGMTDIENQIPADENACFEWGSISKTFIWVSAFQLLEQGRLELDRDVREYLPDGFFRHLSYDEPITMLHLMNHNAGWQETSRPIMKQDPNAIGSLHDELQAIEPAQIHRPGEVVAYSNYGAAVAGYVIECITGQDFGAYVHEHIFEPLGMEHTAISPTHADCPFVFENRQRMHSYSIFSMSAKAIDLGTKPDYIPCYPAGAACGTLADMIRYGQALLDDSAPLFAHPETQQALLTGTDFYGTSDIPVNCHGFWCSEHSVRIYGHTGSTLFGQADLEFDPVSKYGIAVMVNEPDGNDFLDALPDLVFGALDPETYGSAPLGKADLRGYYSPARSNFTGMLRFMPYLMTISADQLGIQEAEELGNGVLQLIRQDPVADIQTAAILGKRLDENGHLEALESPSCDLLVSRHHTAYLCLIAFYLIAGMSAVYLLLIRARLRRAGRWSACPAAEAMTAARIARILSVVLFLTVYVVYSRSHGGIPYGAGQAIGIGQMLCCGICGVSILLCIGAMIRQKEHAGFLRYLPHCAMNALCVTTVIIFELYKYWGI